MALKKTLIFYVPLIFLADFISARDDFKILLEFLPDSVTQNEAFTINLVVSHPNPEEIYVRPPDFNDMFRMERVRTEVRLVRETARSSERYTVFEFLLIPGKAGLQEIGSFEVEVLGKTKTSSPMTVYVQAEEKNFKARLAWFGRDGRRVSAASASIGEAYETALRIILWEQGRSYPETFPVPVEAPENAIVEKLPLSKNDLDTGIVLRLRIVPLDGKTVNINGQAVGYEKSWIEIPALTLKVLPAAGRFTVTEPGETLTIKEEGTDAARQVGPVLFSGMSDGRKTIAVLRRGSDRLIAAAERLWGEEKYAEALAVLRGGEMTLSAGGSVGRVRAACEAALHLPSGGSEPWFPRRPMLVVLALSPAAFAVLFLIRKSREKKGKNFISAPLLSVIPLVFLLDLSALLFSYSYEKRRAVLKYCAAYPIPEEDVDTAFFFMEGQAVNIRSKSGSWFYVESAETGIFEKLEKLEKLKKSGWIKKENAVVLAP